MTVVLVAGGRDFTDEEFVSTVLDRLHSQYNFSKVVQGGAKGVDIFALCWARKRKIPFKTYPADWDEHGRAAGGIRNSLMLNKEDPNLVVLFPGGVGTADMRRKALDAGKSILEIPYD